MTNISGFFRLSVLLTVLAVVGLGWAADQKNSQTETKAKSQPVSKIDLSLWQKPARPSSSGSPGQNVTNPWLERYQGKATPASKAPVVQTQPAAPNAFVNVASPAPLADQTSATVSLSEFFPGEIYSAWTDPFGPGPGIPSGIGTSFSPALGIPGSWAPPPSGPILPATIGPPAAFVRHPSMGSHPLGGHIVGYQGYGGGLGFLGGSAIWTDATFGGGGPWGGFGPLPPIAVSLPAGCCADYFDYPSTIIDDWPGTPSPPEFGAVFYTWTAFADGDGDPNGDGNFFNDPADASFIAYSFGNTLGGPFPFPGPTSPPIAVNLTSTPIPLALQSDLAIVSPAGAGPLPPGALYVAWTDGYAIGGPPLVGPPPEGMMFLPSSVWIDVSPAPGAGAPFGFFGGNVFVAPVVPIGPLIGGGTQAMSTVTVAVNNATYPNPCGPGAVYAAWSSALIGDPDIWFSASFAGGGPGTWTPPVRVNQDPAGPPMRDQWAPSMAVDSLGNINIIFYDRRMDPALNTATEVWMASSFDCGATWTDMPLSDGGPVPPATTIPPGYIGDYIDIDENAFNGAGSIWNDSRPSLANQDVWFENIKPTCIAKAGDANASGTFTLADPIAIVNYVFGKPGCIPLPNCWLSNLLCRGDWNGSGTVTLADVIRAVNYIFAVPGGPWLAIPIGQCCAPVP